MLSILVDDFRSLGADITVRTYQSAYDTLSKTNFDFLMLDHDLGGRDTGYDLLKRLLPLDRIPKEVQLVTSNPVGKENMANILKDYGYTQITPSDFILED